VENGAGGLMSIGETSAGKANDSRKKESVKMIDSDVIRALECCKGTAMCDRCPYYGKCGKLTWDALNLINRQQAEIEMLRKYNTDVAFKHYNDGIKELADRLKECTVDIILYGEIVTVSQIDNLVKEMTEGFDKARSINRSEKGGESDA
jgi:hypothetical protein